MNPSKIFDAGKRKLVVGVEWRYATSKAEVSEALKSVPMNAAYFRVRNGSGPTWIGRAEGKLKGVLAAAPFVGLVAPNALICEAVDEEFTWLCALQDGMPVPGYDWVVPAANASTELQQMMSLFSSSELYGDVSGAKSRVADLFDKVEEAIGEKAISGRAVRELQSRKKGLPDGVFLIVVLLAGIGYGGWFGWDYYTQLQKKKRLDAEGIQDAARLKMTQEEAAAEKRRLQMVFDREVEEKKAEFLAEMKSGQSSPLWIAMSQVRAGLPLSWNGYKPQSMQCDRQRCVITWEASGRFQSIGGKESIVGALDGSDLGYVAKTEVRLNLGATGTAIDFDDGNLMRLRLTDRFGRRGITFDEVKPVTIVPPGGIDRSPIVIGAAGTFNYTATGPFAAIQAMDLLQELDRYPAAVSSIEVTTLSQRPSFRITGKYGGQATPGPDTNINPSKK